jgi:DeoR/GlpR family transcriptional regulator of sugar metabolism
VDATNAKDTRLRYESAPARRERILDLVRESGFCVVSEVAKSLGVSEMTVRRDFRELADMGLVRQVHGGVSALTSASGPIDFRLRAVENQGAKRAIAKAAVGLLEPGSVVAFDAGTTTLEVARQLPEGIRLTVVTHSLPTMSTLAGRSSIEIIGVGGQLHNETQAFAGAMTVRSINEVRVQTALLAATSVRDGAMWCTNTFDAETKQALLASSDRVVLLVDSSKFSATSVMRVGGLDGVHTVVTDDGVAEQTVRQLERSGTSVVIAGT